MLDQEERWLTYAEVGELLDISAEAARALARRQKWSRRTPNEHNALARVLVPPDRPVARPRPAGARGMNGGHPGYGRGAEELRPAEHDRPGDTPDILRSAVRTLESAVEGLREQLQTANQRTEQAEHRVETERARADQAERRLADKDATITGLVAEQQAMRQQVETLTGLLKTRRLWWPWRRREPA